MSDRETLEKHGYSYNPMSGSWLKVDGKTKSVLSIYGIGDGVVLAVKSMSDVIASKTAHLTIADAIAAGEKWLVEEAAG